jgi:putative addiction module CopG family antidote
MLQHSSPTLAAGIALPRTVEKRARRGYALRRSMTKPSPLDSLPENLLAFAEERVREGEYASLAEVLEDALRLLLQRHERRQMLRAELADVLQQIDEHIVVEVEGDSNADP